MKEKHLYRVNIKVFSEVYIVAENKNNAIKKAKTIDHSYFIDEEEYSATKVNQYEPVSSLWEGSEPFFDTELNDGECLTVRQMVDNLKDNRQIEFPFMEGKT